MTKVIPQKACVTRHDGATISLVRDQEYDLAEGLAKKLIAGGLVVLVESETERDERLAAEQAEAERLAAEQAEAERLAAEQAEAERLAAEQVEKDKAAAAKTAAVPKKGAASGKKLDGAPENK